MSIKRKRRATVLSGPLKVRVCTKILTSKVEALLSLIKLPGRFRALMWKGVDQSKLWQSNLENTCP